MVHRMIVKHTIASFYREKKRNIKQGEAFLRMSRLASWSDHDVLHRMVCNVTVNDILAHLPKKFRHVLVLRYLQELDIREIALVLNESLAVISNWISYAKKLIRKRACRADNSHENMFVGDMVV